MKKNRVLVLLIILAFSSFSQNEFAKWYFGKYTGLDFMNNPPSVINHTTLNTFEGSASAADGAGSLLFYTDGITIWNKQQLVMANGTGLFGNSSTVQSALITKQPGNPNIYFVFTLDFQGGANGLCYSIVDMNLAAGMGSVTVKNIQISTPCTEQLTGVRHCNGIDMWIVSHRINSNDFQAHLLTSSGVNSTPVVSSIGPVPPLTANIQIRGQGTIKISPNGKKLGLTFINGLTNSEVAIFDFNKSSGIVSNYLSLITGTVNYYGCDFSGDGTKFYASSGNALSPLTFQWDLCGGSNAQILASQTSVGSGASAGQLQLAPDGKIYIVSWASQSLSIINNPDQVGTSCNFTFNALSVASGSNGAGLPNFIAGVYKNVPAFTFTVNPLISCATASFAAPPMPTVNLSCAAANNSVIAISWNFGQPQTGSANTSTLNNPTHNFLGPGSYTVKLIYHYPCGADTAYKKVTIASPTISVNSSSINCSSPGNATITVAGSTGLLSYTWIPSLQSTSIATVNPGSYTIHINDNGGNCSYTYTTNFSPPNPFTGTINASTICFSATNGTAGISLNMGTGGTGLYVYNWSNGQSTPSVSGLAAGIYSVTVVDSNCVFSNTFQILQLPAISLTIVSPTNQVCMASLVASASGGAGTFTYSWNGSPGASSFAVTQTVNGTAFYTVTATDQMGCSRTATTQVYFLASPSLAVESISICIKTNGILSASGATGYTWYPSGTVGSSISVSPPTSMVYSVVGSYSNGCTSNKSVSITVLSCTSLEERSANNLITIFPNPISTVLYIESQESIEVTIYDARGKFVLSQKCKKGLNSINTENLSAGTYYIKALGEFSQLDTKVFKQ